MICSNYVYLYSKILDVHYVVAFLSALEGSTRIHNIVQIFVLISRHSVRLNYGTLAHPMRVRLEAVSTISTECKLQLECMFPKHIESVSQSIREVRYYLTSLPSRLLLYPNRGHDEIHIA